MHRNSRVPSIAGQQRPGQLFVEPRGNAYSEAAELENLTFYTGSGTRGQVFGLLASFSSFASLFASKRLQQWLRSEDRLTPVYLWRVWKLNGEILSPSVIIPPVFQRPRLDGDDMIAQLDATTAVKNLGEWSIWL